MLRFYYITTYITIGDRTYTLSPALKTIMKKSDKVLTKETLFSGNTFDSLYELDEDKLSEHFIFGIKKYIKKYFFNNQRAIKIYNTSSYKTHYRWEEKQGNQEWKIWYKYEYFKPNLEYVFKRCSVEEAKEYLKERNLECLFKLYNK